MIEFFIYFALSSGRILFGCFDGHEMAMIFLAWGGWLGLVTLLHSFPIVVEVYALRYC